MADAGCAIDHVEMCMYAQYSDGNSSLIRVVYGGAVDRDGIKSQ